ncbi:hypothetical protein MYSTI_06871 [Myxococcus stipitatus DSM 14675]|uniref:Uncharacterized protein n=1 Tax=Myxococcus stipitatus (strain DSM 14675 / JCM 12634 / Mx s8) TaxID=1278073 RepID=L7UNT1_MYXSD|nr:hypothetical protein [Myxococcus stipitatus]AGC48144.1 hypothetical protein MYSTI_06871 [Myxococcus stipitatus DSM 14675]
MFIRDPADFLQRMPELRALCEDVRVRRAVERGDSFNLYWTLKWARWSGRLRSQRQVLDTLLKQRRLFARPLKEGRLRVGMRSGFFGTLLLGKAEPDPVDGTVITTHWVVSFFMIPLFPLGAYVGQTGDGDFLHRPWRIFARVPLGTWPALWSRLVSLSAIALVLGGGGQAIHASRHRDVHVGNAFKEPLRVVLDEEEDEAVVLSPGEVRALPMPLGTRRLRAASQSGVEVDTLELEVKRGEGLLMWNIAGGMPVFLAQQLYSDGEPSDGPPPTVYCGQRVIELGPVNHLFKTPPGSPSSSRARTHLWGTYVNVERHSADLLSACFSYLGSQNRWAEALTFTQAAVRLSGGDEATVSRALRASIAKGGGEATRFMRALRDANPERLEWHRGYQWTAELEGQADGLLAEYAERAKAAPDSADAQYLHVRMLPTAERRGAGESLLARFPTHMPTLRLVTHQRFLDGDWTGTVEGWAQLRGGDEKSATELLEPAMTAFVALGRFEEARRVLVSLFDTAEPSVRSKVAGLHALVVGRSKGAEPDALVQKLRKEDGGDLWVRARLGRPIEKLESTPTAVRLMFAVRKDPKEALGLARSVQDLEMSTLAEPMWALLYAEAVRLGDAEAQRSLERFLAVSGPPRENVRRFIRGEVAVLDVDELPWDVRAAVYFVRSRDSALPKSERRRLLEQARQADWFHGVVSEAITSWSP